LHGPPSWIESLNMPDLQNKITALRLEYQFRGLV
jgi:hypothetical protein